MPTANTFKSMVWALVAVAVVSRLPMARDLVFGSSS